MFINFTNHPSLQWDQKQTIEANKYGEIIDISFPNVSPIMNCLEIEKLAFDCYQKIVAQKPLAVLVQGEMTLCYHVISLLKQHNIKVLCACSQRMTQETVDINGRTIKQSVFEFVQFREY